MSTRAPAARDTGVVIPLRSFSVGKARLANRLDPKSRSDLARRMAGRVVDAAGCLPCLIVTSDPEVVAWAAARDVTCIDDPGSLDGAASDGLSRMRSDGLDRVVVAHADLPLLTTLEQVASDGAARVVVAVPCHRDDGTPVLSVPTDVEFRFAYGPGSFARHCAEAARLGMELRVVRDRSLSFDIDLPEDLDLLETLSAPTVTPPSTRRPGTLPSPSAAV